MVDPQQHDDVIAYNNDSLRTLSRAIVLAQGRFSLILVRCNYQTLQEQMQQQLQEICPVETQELILHGSTKTLYTFIKTFIEVERDGNQPQALIISGLETVADLDHVLTATNQVRDDFRNSFTFPLVLWVNDNILYRLAKLAPDFHSWAGVPIRFTIATEDLITLLRQQTDKLFDRAMNTGAGRFPRSSALYLETDVYSQRELKVAIEELHQRQQEIDPILQASLQFILGLDAHANDRLNEAREHYEQSLTFWQYSLETGIASTAEQDLNPGVTPSDTLTKQPNVAHIFSIRRKSCVQFYLGLWWRRYAALHRAQFKSACQKAQVYYRQSIKGLLQFGQEELAAKFIIALGEVLQRLEQWDELEGIAQTSVRLHQTYHYPVRLAYSYGLLAEVALARSQWQEAKDYAEQALETNQQLSNASGRGQEQYHDLSWAQRHYRSLYLLLLTQAERKLGLLKDAEQNLETARSACNHAYDPLLYTRILESLRSFYYEQGRYLDAFNTKQEQRSLEQQYGLRAFIGAGRLQPERQVINPALVARELSDQSSADADQTPTQPIAVAQEIEASGRQQDVERLIERLGRNDYKLTIIHGQSGVGKSSIINAGLIPSLVHRSIDARVPLPIVLNVYTDWLRELSNRLVNALEERGIRYCQLPETEENLNPQLLLDQLQENADRRSLLTVLIFDQFEEFFFIYPDPVKRLPFFDFFGKCLNLPFVKVVFSLREDYLHYLLECDRLNLDILKNDSKEPDILGRKNRYPLGNFSPPDARLVIQQLTQRSQFSLEPALIDRLVDDLSAGLGEVRPIELQVVGAQLQEDDVTTLHQYEALGEHPKEMLVEQFLEQVVHDCGSPNEEVAGLVLYFLTDEKGTRPLKTRDEIIADLLKTLDELTADLSTQETEQIILVLEILVKSGLVLLLPEVPAARYQLVHDYLVALIREKQRPRMEELLSRLKKTEEERDELSKLNTKLEAANAELKAEREHRRRTEEELDQAEQTINLANWEIQRANRLRDIGGAILVSALVTAIASGVAIFHRSTEVQARKENVQLERQGVLISQKFDSDPLNALLEAMVIGEKLQEVPKDDAISDGYSASSPVSVLRQILDDIRAKNLLIGEPGDREFYSVSYSPDGQKLAVGTANGTVRLWDAQGRKLSPLTGHTGPVRRISFSPNGSIATASDDGTVRVWNAQGELLDNFTVGGGAVMGISFNPEGNMVATASADGMAKLWNLQGQPLAELEGHTASVQDIQFSPDGERLATASIDGTVQLWDLQGRPIDEISNNRDNRIAVWSISFSPDGKQLAIASDNGVARVWNLSKQQFMAELKGHTAAVLDVRFSPDGKSLVTTSADRTVRLWDWQAERELTEFRGHRAPVFGVSFSPDQKNLATVSADGKARLWDLSNKQPPLTCKKLDGNESKSRGASFSPSGKLLATTSVDNAICVWSVQGPPEKLQIQLQNTFKTQDKGFLEISFTDEQHLVTTSSDGNAYLWDLQGNRLAELPTGKEQPVWSVHYDPQQHLIATGSNDGVVRLWNAQGEPQDKFQAYDDVPVQVIRFSPDGSSLATASKDGRVRLWKLQGNARPEELRLRDDQDPILALSFSPDGNYLAAASVNGNVGLWQLENLQDESLGLDQYVNQIREIGKQYLVAGSNESHLPNHQFAAHEGQIYDISFSLDGQYFATAADDRSNAKLWDLQGRLLAELQGPIAARNSKFSPTSQIIAVTSEDGTARLWPVENLDTLLQRGCEWLDDYFVTNPQDKERLRSCQTQ